MTSLCLFQVMRDIFPNRHGSDSLDRMGSLWFGSNDRSACSLRFCGLQKLQVPTKCKLVLAYGRFRTQVKLAANLNYHREYVKGDLYRGTVTELVCWSAGTLSDYGGSALHRLSAEITSV